MLSFQSRSRAEKTTGMQEKPPNSKPQHQLFKKNSPTSTVPGLPSTHVAHTKVTNSVCSTLLHHLDSFLALACLPGSEICYANFPRLTYLVPTLVLASCAILLSPKWIKMCVSRIGVNAMQKKVLRLVLTED